MCNVGIHAVSQSKRSHIGYLAPKMCDEIDIREAVHQNWTLQSPSSLKEPQEWAITGGADTVMDRATMLNWSVLTSFALLCLFVQFHLIDHRN